MSQAGTLLAGERFTGEANSPALCKDASHLLITDPQSSSPAFSQLPPVPMWLMGLLHGASRNPAAGRVLALQIRSQISPLAAMTVLKCLRTAELGA